MEIKQNNLNDSIEVKVYREELMHGIVIRTVDLIADRIATKFLEQNSDEIFKNLDSVEIAKLANSYIKLKIAKETFKVDSQLIRDEEDREHEKIEKTNRMLHRMGID